MVWIFALLLSGAIAAGAAFAVYLLETGSAGHDLAIVTGKNIQARLATAESAGTVLRPAAGKRNQDSQHARRVGFTPLCLTICEAGFRSGSAERVRL